MTLTPCTLPEFPQLLSFLDMCFKKTTHHWFAHHLPHIFQATEESVQHHHVVHDGSRIIGVMGIYPLALRYDKVRFSVGGIGSVAVDPQHRTSGLMTTMLKDAIAIMDGRDYDISWLRGDRTRYRAFGWETGGRCVHFQISVRDIERNFGLVPRTRVCSARASHINELDCLYRAYPSRIVRSKDAWRIHLVNKTMEWTRASTSSGTAYCATKRDRPDTICEMQGTAAACARLLVAYMRQKALDSVTVMHHDCDDGAARLLWKCAGEFHIQSSGYMRVVNPDSTARKLRELGASIPKTEPRQTAHCRSTLGFSPHMWQSRGASPSPLPWWFSSVDFI